MAHKTKKRPPRYLAATIAASVAFLGLGTVAAAAPGEEQSVALILARLAEKTGSVELALKLGDWLNLPVGGAFGATRLTDEEIQAEQSAFSSVGIYDGDASPDDVTIMGHEFCPLGFTTTTPCSWRNETGEIVWIDRSRFFAAGATSGTLFFSAGTSTVSGVPYNNTAEPRGILDRLTVPSSSLNVMFSNSRYYTLAGTNYGAVTSTPDGIPVRPNEYVLLYVRAENSVNAVTSTRDIGTTATTSYFSWDWRIDSTSTPR